MEDMTVRKFLAVVGAIVVLVLVLAGVQIFRPVPTITVAAKIPATVTVPGQLNVSWPTQGEAALEVVGEGVMGSSGSNTELPIASLAKMMTAYLVLKAHPLAPGAQGPTITITPEDVQVYKADVKAGDSVAQVAVGEKLTEYQLLQALLLPSGDNIATLLANWVSGDTATFVSHMNSTAKSMGMTNTHYADPAGVDPTTVSTALDQLKIADAAMQDPIFREIVAQPQATLPVGGTVYNVDYEVGKHGIVGIKTGSTSLGANFAFASYANVGGKQVLVIGTVLGQNTLQSLQTALNYGVSLEADAKRNLRSVNVYTAGQSAAELDAKWGDSVDAVGRSNVSLVGWPGMAVQTHVVADKLKASSSVTSGETVARLVVDAAGQTTTVPLTANADLPQASLKWKLTRIP